jgi:hypothetical protein
MRGGEHPLEGVCVLRRPLFQEREEATTLVIQHDDAQVRTWLVRTDH